MGCRLQVSIPCAPLAKAKGRGTGRGTGEDWKPAERWSLGKCQKGFYLCQKEFWLKFFLLGGEEEVGVGRLSIPCAPLAKAKGRGTRRGTKEDWEPAERRGGIMPEEVRLMLGEFFYWAR